ncbi:MAG: hypothetical protein ABI690_28255 [Chloroflexota bacterium]
MPVIYQWDNSDKTVLCYRLEGRWTWDEIYQMLEEARALWKSVNHTVDMIVDMTGSAGFPPDNILGHFRNITLNYHHANTGNTAVVGADDFFRMASGLFYKVYVLPRQQPRGNTLFVKDMDSARAALSDQRKNAKSGS